jgi:hypothetical protein
MIIEEGGCFEDINHASSLQTQLSLDKLAEMQIVRTRVRDDTPGVV